MSFKFLSKDQDFLKSIQDLNPVRTLNSGGNAIAVTGPMDLPKVRVPAGKGSLGSKRLEKMTSHLRGDRQMLRREKEALDQNDWKR